MEENMNTYSWCSLEAAHRRYEEAFAEAEYIPEDPQTVSFELIDGEYDVTVEYDLDAIRDVAQIANWYVTEAGRVKPIDWHLTGLSHDEICELIEDLLRYELRLDSLWL
jgi:hypothetical protein